MSVADFEYAYKDLWNELIELKSKLGILNIPEGGSFYIYHLDLDPHGQLSTPPEPTTTGINPTPSK